MVFLNSRASPTSKYSTDKEYFVYDDNALQYSTGSTAKHLQVKLNTSKEYLKPLKELYHHCSRPLFEGTI